MVAAKNKNSFEEKRKLSVNGRTSRTPRIRVASTNQFAAVVMMVEFFENIKNILTG